ncbi:GDP-mannose 4,6-dehydratase [Nocardioides jiangxiensis]|uniref:GDP-mannose 4,6-dehydratase n=1 Tax=Nocardioides jiangxiensis TaxID=3064524 RepID=A0ABT9B3T2_9ACTN|nr:GDP-mannose 4,6-dehydratase [Nocardioides sp. WY-20]MDO7867813.1 GDP-mannose 4,6-dehydratase [Nocardioides sp. WY-20]
MPATRAFVTGASGQDGSYLAERLIADGVEVHALTLSGEVPAFLPADVVVHRGDLTDVAATRALLADLAPDEVYNLAALSSVAASWEDPDRSASVNGGAAVALLESAWQVSQAHDKQVAFIQCSSAEIFGEPAQSPQSEDTPLRPVNPYGAAKAYAHLMTGVYRSRGLHASSMVLYNHESPRRSPRFVTRKITSTVAAIARGRADSLVLGNLDARRDFGWAPDYVDAMVRAARHAQADDYVVATGKSHSVREFVAAAFQHAGVRDWEPMVHTDPSLLRPTDPTDLTGDFSRARTVLGWKPSVSFHEIVARMVDADLVEP